jgi:ectoine hydroxylase-related dioxygenase (phytanoyl-CoA dioxygenase family)
MSTTLTEQKSLTAPNGHHLEKGGGKTTYQGVLEALPRPDSIDVDQAVQQMYTHGYAIFPNVIDSSEVAMLRSIMDDLGGPDDSKWEVKNWCYNRQHRTDFCNEPRFLSFIDRPILIDTVRAILDPGAHVTGGSLWTTGHGRAMGIHIDYLPMNLPESVHEDPSITIPIFSVTAHFYLNEMTAELGPTTLIPGSHKAGRPPLDETTWHGIAPQAAIVRAGDVLLFRGDLWHGSGMNSCETERRYMMQIHYGSALVERQYPAMRWESLWSPT